MDNLTHSLVGALLGQAGLKRKTGLAMPALIIGANLPDVDAACFFWLDGVEHLGFRRGITHGPPALVLLPLVLAGVLYGFDRWQAGRGKRPEGRLPVRFGWLYALAFLGCLTHPALDWLNVYGIRLLEPFSSQWFYGDTLFIIDFWLWALMGFATWFSLRREKRGGEWKRPARAAIAVALAYIGVNGVISARQVSNFEALVPGIEKDLGHVIIASPVPLYFWQREIIYGYPKGHWAMYLAKAPWKGPALPEVRRNSVEIVPTENLCVWQNFEERSATNSQMAAFLFWSRAPLAERGDDGSVVLRDARFYDPRARDQFSVKLFGNQCSSWSVN